MLNRPLLSGQIDHLGQVKIPGLGTGLFRKAFGLCFLGLILVGCANSQGAGKQGPELKQDPNPSQASAGLRYIPITILATNDIHGGVDPSLHAPTGSLIGGLDLYAGIVASVRKGVEAKGGGVVVLDAGDQFQGTLISNFNEGELVFKLMGEIGYDAVVPGNHDYDFGPKGWLKDRATAPGENPREVIEGLAENAKFPLISANTYFRKSLVDRATGASVEVASHSCAAASGIEVDWKRARRPDFLKPYVIKKVAGIRVALIGLDNPATANMTTAVNVSDLCFRDPVETYTEIANELKGQAEIFVLAIHGADAPGSYELSDWVRTWVRGRKLKLDAVVAGHTHMIQNSTVEGVKVIQSGSGGERFGRIDLVYDSQLGQVIKDRTVSISGAAILHSVCDKPKVSFCEKVVGGKGYNGLSYEAVPVEINATSRALIEAARKEVAPIADRKLFSAKAALKRNRTSESAVSNLLTDALRSTSGTDIAFMNTGGIRSDLEAGTITYEQFFSVLPFGNLGVVAEPMSTETLLRLLQRSIETCGAYGALMQSGLRVEFTRDCAKNKGNADPNAKLLRVETVSGEVILDESKGIYQPARSFRVATLDFLLDGGSGYADFKGLVRTGELGILRERLTEEFLNRSPQIEFDGQVDGRWKDIRGKETRATENPKKVK
ncbi:MAG: bifunctional metallophosphatase/5'-nucleotidase [Oligoflexia bacterium]